MCELTNLFDESVVIKQYAPEIGVEVEGLGNSKWTSLAIANGLRRLLDRYLVVVVRDQFLQARSLRELVRHFGPLFLHHADEGVIFAEGFDDVLEMRKEPDGNRLFGGSEWHADVTFRNPAGLYSALSAQVLPIIGGDTGFASTVAAYDGLSAGMREFLQALNAVHSYNGPGQPDHPTETAVHPVIREHPVTKRKGIYLNKMFVSRFEGMSEAESKPLIDYFDQYMSQSEFIFRHRWREGDLVIWDNRFTLHYPINDFTGQRRVLYRCTAMEQASN